MINVRTKMVFNGTISMKNGKASTPQQLIEIYQSTFSLPALYQSLTLPRKYAHSSSGQQLAAYLSLLNTRHLQLKKEAHLLTKWSSFYRKEAKNSLKNENELQEANTLLQVLQQKKDQIKVCIQYLKNVYPQWKTLQKGLLKIVDELIRQTQMYVSPQTLTKNAIQTHNDEIKKGLPEKKNLTRLLSEATTDTASYLPCQAQKVKLSAKEKREKKRLLTEAEVQDIRLSCSGKYRTRTFFKHPLSPGTIVSDSKDHSRPKQNIELKCDLKSEQQSWANHKSPDIEGLIKMSWRNKQSMKLVAKSRFALNQKRYDCGGKPRVNNNFLSNTCQIIQTIEDQNCCESGYQGRLPDKKLSQKIRKNDKVPLNESPFAEDTVKRFADGQAFQITHDRLQKCFDQHRKSSSSNSRESNMSQMHCSSQQSMESYSSQPCQNSQQESPLSSRSSASKDESSKSIVLKPSKRSRNSFTRTSSTSNKERQFRRRVASRIEPDELPIPSSSSIRQKVQKLGGRCKRMAVVQQHRGASTVQSKGSSKPKISMRGSSIFRKRCDGGLFLKVPPEEMRFEDMDEEMRNRVSEAMGRKRPQSKHLQQQQQRYTIDKYALVSDKARYSLLGGIQLDASICGQSKTKQEMLLQCEKKYQGLSAVSKEMIRINKPIQAVNGFRIEEMSSVVREVEVSGSDEDLLKLAQLTIRDYSSLRLVQRGLDKSD